MIIHRKLPKMKNKILPTCLQGNYGDSLGEFINTSDGVVGAERVNNRGNTALHLCFWKPQTWKHASTNAG